MLKNEEEKYKQKRENPEKRKGNLRSGDFSFFFFCAVEKNTICNTTYSPPPPKKKKIYRLIAG